MINNLPTGKFDHVTQLALILLLIVAFIYDMMAIWTMGSENTFSHVIFRLSKTYPIIPLLIGIFLGHLFW